MPRTVVSCAIVALIALLLCSGLSPAAGDSGIRTSTPIDTAFHEGSTRTVSPAISPAGAPPSAFRTGMAASVVIGSSDFTTMWSNDNASAFVSEPEYSSFDAHGDLWVTDYLGNRVLEFVPPFSNGMAATLVIGQTTLTGDQAAVTSTNLSGPSSASFDAQGDLWVTDYGNSRVLEYVPPFHDGMAATIAIGEPNFVTGTGGTTATTLQDPNELSFDALGDLWVTDFDNNRVLEYVPPFSTGMAATLAIGQTSFTTRVSGLTSSTFLGPDDAIVSGDTLWVADGSNNRVLWFEEPFMMGEAASGVIGQTSFTTSSSTGESATVFPNGVTVDSFGNLWVSDAEDNRVLEFTTPFSDFEAPAVVIGQNSLTGNVAGTTATNLSLPYGTAFDASGDLWVTDTDNNRVLEYIPTHYNVSITPVGLPGSTPWTAMVDGQSLTSTGPLHFSELNGTHSLQVTPVAGYRVNPSSEYFAVNASSTNVVVQFTPTGPNPFSAGMPASVVIGQPNFDSANVYLSATANDLATEGYAAAFDASGNLWVADNDFNRVLEYRPPFTNFMNASLVLGQSTFHGYLAGNSATNLSRPEGLAFAPNGDLWVAEEDNNRVVEYVPPFTDGMAASVVLGQPGFGSSASGTGAGQLDEPSGMVFYNNSLWVADYSNNRVVEFTAPFSNGENASLVLGQSNLTGFKEGTTATNLSDPAWVDFDSHGNAWVADDGNSRVLEYRAPIVTGEAASVVLGQPNFTATLTTGPNSLSDDNGLWIDGHGNVWVADSGDNRVVEYAGPTTSIVSNQTPINVLGQSNLTTTGANTSRTGLAYPTAVTTDPNGNIWVVDQDNQRVLGYIPTQYPLGFTETGLPAGTPWGVVVNGTTLASSSTVVSTVEVNGTFSWTTVLVPGWSPSPASDTTTVNGAVMNVSITYTRVTYQISFGERGLPSGTDWSLTVEGMLYSSISVTVLDIDEPNGSYSYTAGVVAGYNSTNGNGTGIVTVSAGPNSVTITYTATSSPSKSSSPSGLSSTDWIIIAVVILAIVAALLAVVLMRRKKAGPPTAWQPPAPGGSPPAASLGPPPGVTNPPPPPS
jgi:sugar lactone lactonase YvrE